MAEVARHSELLADVFFGPLLDAGIDELNPSFNRLFIELCLSAFGPRHDVWERKRRLLLETFVSNPNVDVRRSIIASLTLDPTAYPETHRPLVVRAIEIARGSDDEYIRHRVEVGLGNVNVLAPLPYRKQTTGPAEPGSAADTI